MAKDEPNPKKSQIVIHVDRTKYKVDVPHMSGAEIRALAGIAGDDVDLNLEETGDTDDRLIRNEDVVELKNGMHFFTTPRHITPGHD